MTAMNRVQSPAWAKVRRMGAEVFWWELASFVLLGYMWPTLWPWIAGFAFLLGVLTGWLKQGGWVRKAIIGAAWFAIPCTVSVAWLARQLFMEDLLNPWHYGVIAGCIGLTGAVIGSFSNRLKLDSDWKMLSAFAGSKPVMLLTLAFTLIPLIVGFTEKARVPAEALPFSLSLYWLSGAFLFVFVLIYKVAAPATYRYTAYEQVLAQEGGVYFLRDEAGEALLALDSDRQAGVHREKDRQLLQELKQGSGDYPAQAFFLMRTYMNESRRVVRCLLSVLLFVPVFIIPTTSVLKAMEMGSYVIKDVDKHCGWVRAIYGELFDLPAAGNCVPQASLPKP